MIAVATITIDAMIGTGVAIVLVLACIGVGLYAAYDSDHWIPFAFGLVCAAAVAGFWWWGMAFTLSSDYHAWNEKRGEVTAISKRIVPAGDSGIQERFVVRLRGSSELLGIDDTRASLLREGDRVKLRCKKDYEWGTPRAAHGWACKWAMEQ